ncbi:MAG: glycosyltransferase family 4 protein [Candidatus Eremiobacteraeota bacterium]|nr:glycosyltransferase family 4 protein [Candidatus Eremiobacteraeota bacterium]
MKRIGLDARLTRQMSVGMQRYTQELTARLPIVAPDLEFSAFTNGENFGWDEQVALPLAMSRARLDLSHFLSFYTPIWPAAPFIVTIHDLIHLRFPQFFKSKVGPYYATVVRLAAARATRVITDDERTVNDLQRFLGVDPQKCRVIPLGVEDRFLAEITPYRAPQPYLLYVGNHRPHKDLHTLFQAWARLPAAFDIDLYVTGPDDFEGQLSQYQSPRRQIVVLGDVPQEKLPSLYAGSRALVHPALCEGFGLPMLEAMAARCPVIACQDSAPLVMQAAMLLFPPSDVPALAVRLERLLSDEGLRSALVNEGRTLAARLTWDRCASQTAAVYREVLEERGV